MKNSPRGAWGRLSLVLPPTEEQNRTASGLFREYETLGYLDRSGGELAALDVPVIIDFFRRAELLYSAESPLLRRRDSRWMNEYDYTLFNVRASSVDGGGTFISAAMYLTTLRTRGIVLVPVTRGPGEELRTLSSHVHLREELAEPIVTAAGLKSELQMAAFVEAAHLLGLVIGYELDHKVTPLAAVVFHRPELFNWTKGVLPPVRDESVQDELREQVRISMKTLREEDGEPEPDVFQKILETTGLSPVLSDGRTPLALRTMSPGHHGKIRTEAVAYWSRIFEHWRDHYDFDFLVLRGVSELIGEDEKAPDHEFVKLMADAARKSGVCRNVGIAAEADGFDMESLGVLGVDLVFEDDGGSRVDTEWLKRAFLLNEKLYRVNLGRKLQFSVPVFVNPGDKNSRPQRERALLKRFVSRFFGVGPSRRPLLESMGALEGAWGWESALAESRSMGWMPDPVHSLMIKALEDLALRYRDFLVGGERVDQKLSDHTAWWVIRFRRRLLIGILSVENQNLFPPEPLGIDYGAYLKDADSLSILEYDFKDSRGNLRLNTGTLLEIGSLPYRGFRLYVIF